MAMNEGKIFETDWKKSVPDETNCVYERLPDPPQAFAQAVTTRFSNNNPYDNILFRDGTFYALELKSTKSSSISLPDSNEDKKKMIKPHQIVGLTRISKVKGTVAGFIFNFRESKFGDNRTYFMHILDFNKFLSDKDPSKKSINEKDIMAYGYILIENTLKRVHYTYDVDKFLTMTKHQ